MKLIKSLKARLKPTSEVKPLPADHEHNILELPTDWGRKVLKMCTTKGCDFMDTVDATETQQEHVAPLSKELGGLIDEIETDIAAELRRRQ